MQCSPISMEYLRLALKWQMGRQQPACSEARAGQLAWQCKVPLGAAIVAHLQLASSYLKERAQAQSCLEQAERNLYAVFLVLGPKELQHCIRWTARGHLCIRSDFAASC